MKHLQEIINTLPADRRARIEARAEALMAEEMTLRNGTQSPGADPDAPGGITGCRPRQPLPT